MKFATNLYTTAHLTLRMLLVTTLPWEIIKNWVVWYTFYGKFRTLSSSAKILQICFKIWQSYREFKGGNVFWDAV